MKTSVITGVGAYLPEKIMTNHDLSQIVDTNDEWIQARTGIKQRHIVSEGEYTSNLAANASRDAIKKAGLDPNDIDLIVLATCTPDKTMPSTAAIVADLLGITNQCAAFDVNAVCSGFVYAITIADQFIKTGAATNALVIGAETISRTLNWDDRGTCILFGDGAGALVLSSETGHTRGIIDSKISSEGKYADLLCTTGGVSTTKDAGVLTMQGREVFKHAVSKMSASVENILSKNGFSLEDLSLLIPHQANSRILSSIASKLMLSEDNVIEAVSRHANTSSASIPLAMHEAIKIGKVKHGDLCVMTALGAGFTWGSVLFRL